MKRSHVEVVTAMRTFGVELDIDAAHHQRRPCHKQQQHSPTGLSDRAKAAFLSTDIDQVLSKDRTSGRHVSQCSTECWDLPNGFASGAERRRFFDQTHWAARWAELMDRPRKGNRSTIWQAETRPQTRKGIDLPAAYQVHLQQIERDLYFRMGCKQRSRSEQPVRMSQIKVANPDSLFAEELQVSLQGLMSKASLGPGSSSASTASGEGQLFDIEEEIPCSSPVPCSSPAIASTPPGTPHETQEEKEAAETEDGFFHLVNDPKGKHALLQSTSNEKVTTSCQPLKLPLGLRRAMCAVLPADSETSIKLNREQMTKLTGLYATIKAQSRQPRAYKAADVPSKRGIKYSLKP